MKNGLWKTLPTFRLYGQRSGYFFVDCDDVRVFSVLSKKIWMQIFSSVSKQAAHFSVCNNAMTL